MDAQKLREAGLQNTYNINFRESETAVRRALQPYWDLTHTSRNVVNVSIDTQSPDKQRWETIVEEGVNQVMRRNRDRWIPESRRIHYEFVVDGVGPYHWEDNSDPFPTALRNSRFKFPTDTPIRSDRWEIFYIEDEIPITSLWRRVVDAENSEQAGWNIAVLKRALVEAAKKNSTSRVDGLDWNRVQDMLKQNDIACTAEWGNVATVTRFSVNMDGKVDKAVFTKSAMSDKDDYLFEEQNFAEDIRHAIGMIFWDIGNGTIHSVRGFGVLNYPLSLATNIFKSKLLTSADFNMSPIVQRDSLDGSQPPIKNWGGFVNELPNGVRAVPDFKSDYSSAINAIQMIDGVSDRNNQQYNERTEQISKSQSATSAALLGQLNTKADQSNASLYLMQMSSLFSEFVRRLMTTDHKESKYFRKYIKDRGVPDEVLNAYITVESGATSTQLNSALMLQGLKEMLQLGIQRNWNTTPIEEAIAAITLGPDWVRKLMPDTEQRGVTAKRQASMEDSMFENGKPLPVDEIEDDHVAHLEVHISTCEQLMQLIQMVEQAQAIQQPIDQKVQQQIANAKVYFLVAIPHIAGHFKPLARDEMRRDKFQELMTRFQAIQSVVSKLQEFQARGNQPVNPNDAFPQQQIQQPQQQQQLQGPRAQQQELPKQGRRPLV